MQAFGSPLHIMRPRLRSVVTSQPSCVPRTIITIPFARASKAKSSRSKRPRPNRNTSGFGSSQSRPSSPPSSSSSPTSPPPPSSLPPTNQATTPQPINGDGNDLKPQEQDTLQTPDANGITMEHRLREEILHPLRKPKLTLFGTLAFSATLGFFFACARLAAEKDAPTQVATNITIDLVAITIFTYLTWREVDFGRRSLNSIARRPQPRDLPVVILSPSVAPPQMLQLPRNPFAKRPSVSPTPSSSSVTTSDSPLFRLTSKADTVIIAGRTADVRKYLDRCQEDALYASDDPLSAYDESHPVLVALATDARDSSDTVLPAATAVARIDTDQMADWVAWLGDAIPPRRNVALFRIDRNDAARNSANAYVVAIDDPSQMPLPGQAKRLTVLEV